jgi:hypothetical protein
MDPYLLAAMTVLLLGGIAMPFIAFQQVRKNERLQPVAERLLLACNDLYLWLRR